MQLIRTAFLTAFSIGLSAAGCVDDPDLGTITHEGSVIPTVFFANQAGDGLDAATPDDVQVHKRAGDELVPMVTPTGARLLWGEFRKARGVARVTCEDRGTRIRITARNLLPNGVYTTWLAFFDAPGFMAGGLSTITALSAAGPPDGSRSRFDADGQGNAEYDVLVPAGMAGAPITREQAVPACLLESYEVHIVLAYHQDGQTCGYYPCEPDTFGEHVAWILAEGEVIAP